MPCRTKKKSRFKPRNYRFKTFFDQDQKNNFFVEYANVFDNWYGTPKSFIEEKYKRFTVIFDIANVNTKPKAWISVTNLKDLDDDNEVQLMLKSFSKMPQEEIEQSKGLRIKVIRFRDGMTYEQLAKSSPLGKYAIDKLRLLNGHYPDKNPVIGDLIKIVE